AGRAGAATAGGDRSAYDRLYHCRPAAEDSGCGAAVRERNSLGTPAWHACRHSACERALRQEEFLGAPCPRPPLPRSSHLRLLALGAAPWPAIDPLQSANVRV